MIAQAEPKLVAGFRDSPNDLYQLVCVAGALAATERGFRDIVPLEEARQANAKILRPRKQSCKITLTQSSQLVTLSPKE